MGREGADAEEQLQRRLRRVFSAEERSFRMDRRSPVAVALRTAVADVLPRFLGSYTDDTLAEYIVVLICNGKHQYQARDDLKAFLGDDSAKFVAWLWGYLKKALVLIDNSSEQHGLANDSRNLKDMNSPLATKTKPEDARIANSKILVPKEHHGPQKVDSAKGQNVAQRRISSTVVFSPERLVGDQYYWEGNHKKNDESATGSRSFSKLKSGVAGRNVLTQELYHDEHLAKSASRRRSPVDMGIDDDEVSESMKKRRNVWDRLGKPPTEDDDLARETDSVRAQNGVHKKAKLTVSEHEQMCYVNSSTEGDLFDKANSRRFSNSYPGVNTLKSQGHTEKSNRSRLIGRINFGDVERNNLQSRDVVSQKSSLTLPVKGVRSQSQNAFTSEVKRSPAAVSESACHASKSSKQGHVAASNKLSQSTMRINSGTEIMLSEQINSPAQSKSGSSVREDGGSCSNKPVKDEMLDVKLKLKQVELDMLKLRSMQAQLNNGKQGALPSGPIANLEEDADSGTILVTNVHFAASKESLSTHFMKCGTVVKITMLTDAITGHPKGAAYVTFADKESVERAISLNGTSFLSRVLTVIRKAEAPSGFLASVQPTGRPLQPWSTPPFKKTSPPFQKGVTPKPYHLQWKREQSSVDNSPASCPTN